MLEEYVRLFSKLRTDRGRQRYPAITGHRAPHKPFVLLSVMDLIAQGQIIRNLIEPSFEFLDTFNGYWSAVMPPGAKTSMAYPFSRLQTENRGPEPDTGPDPSAFRAPMGTGHRRMRTNGRYKEI